MPAHRPPALRIGISGWRYAPWRGHFYPRGLPQTQELSYAAHQFCTVEINGTFYSLQHPASFLAWRDATPRGFIFSVKGPRYITHTRRLREIEEPLANFFASGVLDLADKLGPILWQFPPTMRWDPERFERFLRMLPRDTQAAARLARRHGPQVKQTDIPRTHPGQPLRHAVEIRHESFATPAFIALLRAHNVALVTADTAGKWPWLEDATADFAYVRLHGDKALYSSGYGARAIGEWARRLRAWADGRAAPHARLAAPDDLPSGAQAGHRDIYCYFDNDVKVMAPRDARALMQALRLPMAPEPPADG
ncbi:DUF72 domain-containing protein [Achromobacter aloeverae]|uniref:DUF72 domain-containing protein n=1 Tax=Achromobacter aloeverae TaxID=1750518 RepID=A0A4V1MSU2_9BURK|nr:DUF72 domain-containing protein [Achromobacter aloeverae]RXN93230.1 DUF72 domain-containing protein [Achromobacter aloeverae]